MPINDIRVMHQSSLEGVDDMILLSQLHESSLLHNLRLRYFKEKIYVKNFISKNNFYFFVFFYIKINKNL